MSEVKEEEVDYNEEEAYEGDGAEEGGGDDGLYDQKDDQEPEEMKRRVEEMEDELDKLTKMQQQVERQIHSAADRIDENSIYVGQVDYEATPEELRAHFAPCGTINRVTIMCDKITGQAKGFAYVEFSSKEAVDNALKLDESLFKGRQLKVLPKRQNVPAFGGRGRGRGRFGGRGGFRGGGGGGGGGRFPGGGRGAPRGRGRGGGGGYRGRGGPGYHNAYY